MPTSHGGQVLTTARSRASQASTSGLRSERSAARCRVFQRRDQKLLKAKTRAQIENAQLKYSPTFQYSARSPVSAPASNTASPTALSVLDYPGGCLLYLRYLQCIIKPIFVEIDVLNYGVRQAIMRLHRIIDSDTSKLKKRVKTMKCNRLRGKDLTKGLQSLNAKKDAVKRSSKNLLDLLYVRKRLYDDAIRRDLELLDSRLAPFPQGLLPQRKVLDLKMASDTLNFHEKMERLTSRYSSFCKMFSDDFMVVDI